MAAETEIHYIDTPAALDELCGWLAEVPWVALDTEFHREKTYFPQLCLLQLATPDLTACVDPLALTALDPLLDILYRPTLTKVMHAARQDMEILFHMRGSLPGPVFDTQLAAPLLGHPEQTGYGALVEAILGVRLGKAHTRADWTRRPLPPEQLRYAADDVVYLARLYPILRSALESRGRLAWLGEDFADLVDPDRYRNPPDDAWQRLRGAERLKDRQLAVLQALAAWRETTARAADLPRGWLIKDEVLLDLARLAPHNTTELGHVRGLNERVAKRHGEELVTLIVAAGRMTPRRMEEDERRGRRLTPMEDALVDALTAVVKLRAMTESLNPATLAPRRVLEQLVRGETGGGHLSGWRRALIGDDLATLLDGRSFLAVRDGKLHLTPTAGQH